MTINGGLRIMRKILVVCLYVFWAIGSSGCGGTDSFYPTYDEPNARAGVDQNVVTGTLVTLDGSGTKNIGNSASFFWSFISLPSGSSATFNNAKRVKPTFTADVDGVYIVQLTVIAVGGTDVDTVVITAATANSTPVASTGADQNVTTGSLVTLDGSGSSDANGNLLSYSWILTSKPANSSARLSDSNAVKPTFLADLDGAYVLSLVVSDGLIASMTESVTVTADSVNSAPIADAGPDQNVATGSTVTLDGRASSDADGDPLIYSWDFIALPPGSSATLMNDSTISPTFTADVSGDYILSLFADDGLLHSMSDSVVVTAIAIKSE